MKFLVYGTKGWIGSKVYRYLKENSFQVIEGNSRVDNIEDLEKEISDHNPTNVISLIGRTHGTYEGEYIGTIDYLEKPGKVYENVRDNLFSPMVLSFLSQKHNFHFTYLGTGCIFNYDDNHSINSQIGFLESDKPNFFGSSYSIVKGFTDRLMHNLFDNTVLNVRIRMPISSDKSSRNFITKITNYKKICSMPNSMTVLDEIIPIIIDMSKNQTKGTINMTNPGVITHNEILEMYKKYKAPEFQWENFSLEEQNNILSSKRSNNYLNTDRLQRLYPEINNIRDAILKIFTLK